MSRLVLLFIVGTLCALIRFTAAQLPLQFETFQGFLREQDQQDTTFHSRGNKALQNVGQDEFHHRLPRSVIPSHYRFTIVPFMENDPGLGEQWTAPGEIFITVTCAQRTNNITIHSFLINIADTFTTVTHKRTSEPVPVTSSSADEPRHFHIVHLGEYLEAGEEYELYFRFVSPISGFDRRNGLYRTSYEDPVHGTKWVVSTQLQSVSARQMFPCFDEPEFKAIFQVSIGRKEKYTSLCNTEQTSMPYRGLPGWMLDMCAPTVPMSTYLVAIVVSEYDCVKATDGFYSKPVQVCGPPPLVAKRGASFAAITSAKQLDFFENLFGIEYALSKMDSVVVPDYNSGAMENWGLNIYRESYLFYYPGDSTELDRRTVSYILAHELTHQWFGNLITGKWWDVLWLNEGFATYYSYIGSSASDPEFELTIHALTNAFQYAMQFDARPDYTHPVLQHVDSPQEVRAIFNRMSYEKAGALIRMMEGFLTEPTLRRGLVHFLNKMSYKPAEQDDLFSSLTEQAHKDGMLRPDQTVKQIMDTWTMLSGFPLLRVSSSASGRLYISQESYCNNGGSENNKPSRHPNLPENDMWYIPLALATEDNPTFNDHIPKVWIPKNTGMISYSHNSTKWIFVNPDGYGYYRVLYDVHLASLLQAQLAKDHNVISRMSRSQLLDDYFNLAFQKYVSIETAMDFTLYLGKETEQVVWTTVITNLRRVYTMLSPTSATLTPFRNYILPRLENVLSQIGWEQTPMEKGSRVILRANLLDWACSMDHPTCINYARTSFRQWQLSPDRNLIPTDLQPVLYCTAVANGGSDEFQFAMDQFRLATSPRQKTLLMNAMACTKNSGLLNKFLDYTLDPFSVLGRNHAIPAMQRIAMNPLGRSAVLRLLTQQADKILDVFGSLLPVSTVVSTVVPYMSTSSQLESINSVIHGISRFPEFAQVESSLNESVAAIQGNIAWMTDYYKPLKSWLDSN